MRHPSGESELSEYHLSDLKTMKFSHSEMGLYLWRWYQEQFLVYRFSTFQRVFHTCRDALVE